MTAAHALYGAILGHLGGKRGLAAKYAREREALLKEVGEDGLPRCLKRRTTLAQVMEYLKERGSSKEKRRQILREEFAPLRRQKPAVVVPQNDGLAIFISHSSDDKHLAAALIELLRSALPLEASAIRCTSVDPYRLAAGAKTDEVLRAEVAEARIFIGLVTPQSLESAYVLFEIGARWGVEPYLKNPALMPLFARMKPGAVPRPLSNLNLLDLSKRAQLYSLVDQIGKTLGLEKKAPAEYTKALEKVRGRARKA